MRVKTACVMTACVKTACLMLASILVFFLPISTAHAAQTPTTIAELSGNAETLNYQQVGFVGEAVGDIINGDDGKYWVTLIDGGASISVLIDAQGKSAITSLGNYQQSGTKLEVFGEFHLSCAEHDGLSDVHASSVRALEAGSPTAHSINLPYLTAGIVFIGIGLALTALYHVRRKKMR